MNLRVDLILESEQRSASLISRKSLIRIVSIVIPAVIVLLVTLQVMRLLAVKNEERAVEARWLTTEPLEKKAGELAGVRRANDALLAELEGWSKSRISWNEQLLALTSVVPTNMQLTELRIGQTFQVIQDKVPARVFGMNLKGMSYGTEAESSVKKMEQTLSQDALFSNLIRRVEVPMYGAANTEGANKDDRIFEIRCGYRERAFE